MIRERDHNPLADHVWGMSPATDRIWAQIAGLAPDSKPWERRFMVLQAYIDESYTANKIFVLGGYIATAETWASFSKEWELLLPLTFRNREGKHRFKMSQMARRLNDVASFFSVIEKHDLWAIHCRINYLDLQRAKERIWFENGRIEWSMANNIYVMSLRLLLDMFHHGRLENKDAMQEIPLNQKVDFYFDEHTSKMMVLTGWDQFIKNRSEEIRNIYGNMPRFEKEEEFLPLQAADFWAWWARKGYEDGKIDDYMGGRFGAFSKTAPSLLHIGITYDEDQLARTLFDDAMFALKTAGHERQIYDAKYYPCPYKTALRGYTNIKMSYGKNRKS